MLRNLGMIAFMVTASAAVAAGPESDVHYGPPADWVLPPPAAIDPSSASDTPLRFVYADTQTRIGPQGVETYNAWRLHMSIGVEY